MTAFWPTSLRARLMALLIPLISLTLMGVGYFLSIQGQEALLKEKRTYLLGISRLLVSQLQAQGGFSGVAQGAPADRDARIQYLNRRLNPQTEAVAQAFPGVGVGYYHKDLDVILTYGPSAEYGSKVGITIALDHPGRQVMASGVASIQTGHLVRGHIMNAMTPIVGDDGQVNGYVWANELMNEVDQQIRTMRISVLGFTLLALVCTLLLIYGVISRFMRDIEQIKGGLNAMRSDLSARIPALGGETGQMAEAVNQMAASLHAARDRERTAADQALARSEETLRAAIDATDEAFILFDEQNRFVFCNERYRQLYPHLHDLLVPGVAYETLLRQAVRREAARLPVQQSEAAVEEKIAQRLALYASGNANLEEQTPGGRWLRVVNRKTATGYTVGFRVDITDLREARDAAEAASRAKGDFLAVMSHELRTPMNGVLGMIDLLLTTSLDAEQQDYAETAMSSAQKLLSLLNDILHFSNLGSGRFVLAQEGFNLPELIHDIEGALRVPVKSKGLDLVLSLAADLPACLIGDPVHLRQLLQILLGNAVKFTERGQVELAVKVMPGSVDGQVELNFVVRDTGIGIPPESLSGVFEPFTQVDSAITRRHGGVGLGLSIAYQLAQQMGGIIRVESTVGSGTVFTVTLPFVVAMSCTGEHK